MNGRIFLLAILLLMVAVIAAVGFSPKADSTFTTEAVITEQAEAVVDDQAAVQEIHLPDIEVANLGNGELHNLLGLTKGKKVTVMLFWNPQCQSCVKQIRVLNASASLYRGRSDVRIFSIPKGWDEKEKIKEAKENLETLYVEGPIVHDVFFFVEVESVRLFMGSILKSFPDAKFPFIVVFDQGGEAISVYQGFIDQGTLSAEIDKLLAAGSTPEPATE